MKMVYKMSKRKFRPRKKLPKDKLEYFLSEGYTLEEIGREFNVATSYVSEYMKMINLDKNDFKDREKNKQKRKQEKNKLTFIEEFWYLIRHEIGR